MCLKVISFMNKMNMKLKKNNTPGKSDATDQEDTKYTSNITPPQNAFTEFV